jgi:hypothetical protein
VDNITVLDSIMGSGKTTYMLNYLNEVQARQNEESFNGLKQRFLYVTPTLAEVDRIAAYCPTLPAPECARMLGAGRHLLFAATAGVMARC